ncbi:hypothetical protein [Alistipes sp.]|uniref:hypothetical protein n=1 Tax=Alistipes sp. TaxID=1872444 RepID=UPI003AF1C38F
MKFYAVIRITDGFSGASSIFRNFAIPPKIADFSNNIQPIARFSAAVRPKMPLQAARQKAAATVILVTIFGYS